MIVLGVVKKNHWEVRKIDTVDEGVVRTLDNEVSIGFGQR